MRAAIATHNKDLDEMRTRRGWEGKRKNTNTNTARCHLTSASVANRKLAVAGTVEPGLRMMMRLYVR